MHFKSITLKNPRATFSQRGWNVASALDGKPDAGWGLSPRFKEAQAAVFDFESPISGGVLKVTLEQQYGQGLLLARSRFSISQNPVQWLRAELQPEPEKVFSETVFPETMRRLKAMQTAKDQLQNFKKQIPSTPVMFDLDAKRQRTTRIHNRGNFLDQGEEVTRICANHICQTARRCPCQSDRRRSVADDTRESIDRSCYRESHLGENFWYGTG